MSDSCSSTYVGVQWQHSCSTRISILLDNQDKEQSISTLASLEVWWPAKPTALKREALVPITMHIHDYKFQSLEGQWEGCPLGLGLVVENKPFMFVHTVLVF